MMTINKIKNLKNWKWPDRMLKLLIQCVRNNIIKQILKYSNDDKNNLLNKSLETNRWILMLI